MPEYAAHVCEVARLLWRASTDQDQEEPQSIHVHPTGRPGSYLIKWFVDCCKVRTNDKQDLLVVRPEFARVH